MFSQSQQKKRGGPLRRPGAASRWSGTATTPTGLGRQKQLSSAAAVRRARKHSTEGMRQSAGANPFQRGVSSSTHLHHQSTNQIPGLKTMTSSSVGMTSSSSSSTTDSSTGNPFFVQLAKKDKPNATTPFGQNFRNPQATSADLPGPPPLPSYAAAVKGPGSIPSFITHGPGSIPLSTQPEGQQSIQSIQQQRRVDHTHQSVGHAPHPSSSVVDNQQQKTLHIKNIPERVNNPPTLRKHFSQYGEIILLDCQPGKRYATLSFSTREAAIKAKKSGRLLCEEPVQIFWYSKPPQRPKNDAPPPTNPVAMATKSRLQDPRQLASVGLEFGGSREGRKEEGGGGGGGETSYSSMNNGGRKRSAHVAGLPTGEEGGRGEGSGGGGGEGGGVGNKSIWERLGDGGGGEGAKISDIKTAGSRPTNNGSKRKVKRSEDDDEWTPGRGEGGREEEEEEEDEGVAEKGDSVLQKKKKHELEREEMDTIARSASHPYYLRSLHKPETIAGIRGAGAVLEIPRQLSERTPGGIQGGVATQYNLLPIPNLPPPPRPQGQSSSDYFQSLDARDEQIRKNLVKQTSLTTEVVVGTCPDMCPEKERYMREDRRRLSWFELDQGKSEPGAPRVDHQRAVKEYNRSAADKAEDLPHELRPESVLIMTMDYLVTCVMDRGDGRTEFWYDFVWNRTRAIRKDITLQHLCSKGAVELHEKCARFHILCAYLLCEEEMAVFDQKMNHENLTKCLITLKQFYRDILIDKGVVCENEAEFCCYDILLHLRDGNVLNIVQQYSQSIRQANIVRFAVDIALSFSSNNYAKFFKLVRSPVCSYLSGCILHRYVVEVQTNAVHVMTKAYTHSKPTSYPLAKFTQLLGFESETAAAEFCAHFDLTVTTKKMIKLERGYTRNPPSSLPLLLSPSLVGAKRVNRCLGEVVNGGPLPLPPQLPPPYDSFAPGTPLAPPTLPRPPLLSYTDRDILLAIDLVLDDVITQELPSVAMETLRNEQDEETRNVVVEGFCQSLFNDCLRGECVEVATTTLRNAQLEWQIRENTQIREEVTEVVSVEIGKEVTGEIVVEIVGQVLRELHEELVAVATSLSDDIIGECVRRECGEVCSEVVREAEALRTAKLEKLEKLVIRERRRKFWKRWCCVLKARRHDRECVSAIPSLPPLLPLSVQLSTTRRPGPLPGVTERLPHSIGQIFEVGVSEFLQNERNNLDRKRRMMLTPLDLPSIVARSLLVSRSPSLPPLSSSHHVTPHIYWSIALLHFTANSTLITADSAHFSTDSAHLSTDSTHFSTDPTHSPHPQLGDREYLGFLEQKLQFRVPEEEDGISSGAKKRPPISSGVRNISLSSTPLSEVGGTGELKIAVKSVRVGRHGNSRHGNNVYLGVSGLILLVPTPQTHQSPESYRDNVMRGVVSEIECISQIPMLVLAPYHLEDSYLAYWNLLRITLQNMLQTPGSFLSHVTFDTIRIESSSSYHNHLDETVCKGLKWLAEGSARQPPLSHLSVRDFVQQGVEMYFLPLVKRDSEIRREHGLPPQNPDHLISLYNAIILHLATTASSHHLTKISWPPPEFTPTQFSSYLSPHIFNSDGLPRLEWNGDLYRAELRECILQHQLVPFDHQATPTANKPGHVAWGNQYHHCLLYLEKYVSPTHKLLLPRIKALLCGYVSHVTFDQSESWFPWDHVILTCIDHMVSVAPTDLWVTCIHDNTNEFATPTLWLRAEAETSLQRVKATNFDLRTPYHRKYHRRNLSDSYIFVSSSTYRHPPLSSTHTPPASHPPSSPSPMATQLAERIGCERLISNDFEAQLRRLVRDGTSVPPPPPPQPPSRRDHTPFTSEWAGSLEAGLRLLKMKIRTSKFQEKMDFNELKRLTQD